MEGLALGEKQQQAENHDGNHRQHDVEQHPSHPRRPPFFPVPELGPVFHAYFLLMLQIVGKFRGSCVAVLGIALERSVNDFL